MPEISLTAIAAQLFTGLVLGGILVLLAIGLSLIFGLMGVVNFAHGSLYMLGAYFGFFLWGLTKSYWAALLIAPLMVGLFGIIVERSMIRRSKRSSWCGGRSDSRSIPPPSSPARSISDS